MRDGIRGRRATRTICNGMDIASLECEVPCDSERRAMTCEGESEKE